MEENFRAWLVAKNLTPEQAQYLALLKNRGLVKGKVSLDDLFATPLSFSTRPTSASNFLASRAYTVMTRSTNPSWSRDGDGLTIFG